MQNNNKILIMKSILTILCFIAVFSIGYFTGIYDSKSTTTSMTAYGDSYEVVMPVTYETAKKIAVEKRWPLVGSGNAWDHVDRYKPYKYVVFYHNGGLTWLQNGHDGPEPKDSDIVGLLMWGPDHH